MRVLVIEDDPTLAESVVSSLTAAGMLPSVVGNGLQADQIIEQATRFKRPFDAIVLDLTLPGMDGMDVLRAMRRRQDFTPVLVLTARVSLADRVGGLECGADDYLAKPYETEELLARLRAIARRRSSDAETSPCVGNLCFNAATGVFAVSGATLVLPPKSQAILEQLFRRRGKPVTKELLMNMDDEGASMESVDTQLSRIRKKLHAAQANVVISTLRGVGYMLEIEGDKSSDALISEPQASSMS